jgi:thymidylate synthase (FAD)
MRVDYIDHMGDDLRAANCARVSFDKWKEEFDAKDASLINYLANHEHWTPFAHCMVSLRVHVPFFLARQLDKHQIGLVKNEVSRRYVDSPPEFYITDKLGARAENKKQGAKEDEFITEIDDYPGWPPNKVEEMLKGIWLDALLNYDHLIKYGVAPEDARMVLPLATYTSWIWTGSLAAYARVYNLRSKSDAQRQTREVAEMISKIIEPLFPHSWRALTEGVK